MPQIFSESDVKEKFITPSIVRAGWDERTQIRREVYFTEGRIYVKGRLSARGKRKFADCITLYQIYGQQIPMSIVEIVEKLEKVCRALEEEISQSEQHAQMLMQAVLKEAFEGEEVKDA